MPRTLFFAYAPVYATEPMPSGSNLPTRDLGTYVAILQQQLNDLRLQIEAIAPPGSDSLGTPNNPFTDVYAQRLVTPYPRFSMLTPRTLAAPQPNADLLVGLNPNARTFLASGLGQPGDVFQFSMTGTITGANGQTAAINIGTEAAGVFITLPIALIGASVGTFFFVRASFTIASAIALNADAIIQGFRNGSVIAGGFTAAGIPFNLGTEQAFTITYATSNLASITINELFFSRLD